ncbi:MAG: hypothetical protein HQK91_05885 [Nitrospirae bacterium]|nr:hypothetical protein [Nitrospirota bacterium]
MLNNFMVKLEDAKLPVLQKALKSAGLKIRSIVELHKEGVDNSGDSKETAAE